MKQFVGVRKKMKLFDGVMKEMKLFYLLLKYYKMVVTFWRFKSGTKDKLSFQSQVNYFGSSK